MQSIILIPVDFSEMTILACRAGLELAIRLSANPVFIFAVTTPMIDASLPYADVFDGEDMLPSEEMDQAMESRQLLQVAQKTMGKFADDIRKRQSAGELPQVKFDTVVEEGVPEDVILNYTREHPTGLVVMATRGHRKRRLDMIGSVTAEVIDSCRVPVFTVPENYTLGSISGIVRLAFFCNLDESDLESLDSFLRIFGYPQIDIWLVPVNEKAGDSIKEKVDTLCSYCAAKFPSVKFHTAVCGSKSFREDFESLLAEFGLQMIIVPNKRKSMIARLFNPGIAHKVLFEKDIPMLALPV